MRAKTSKKASLIKSALATFTLLMASGAAFADSTVNLTAAANSATLPDGQAVPMWGYSCGASPVNATCAAANPNAGTSWSPVVITVPPGNLTINLTNNLTFPLSGGGSNSIATSLVIVGQLGAGLGTTATTTTSPAHPAMNVTWPIAGDSTGPQFNPPPQGPRVQSFSSEIAASGVTPATGQVASGSALTWNNLKPGTYLIESGTHPSIQGSMGLYGVLVVTTAPAGTTAGSGRVRSGSAPSIS